MLGKRCSILDTGCNASQIAIDLEIFLFVSLCEMILRIPLSVLFQYLPADDELLDLIRSFEDLQDAGISVEPFERKFGGESHAAVDLQRLVSNF